jgi:hypothetical protein
MAGAFAPDQQDRKMWERKIASLFFSPTFFCRHAANEYTYTHRPFGNREQPGPPMSS